MTRSTQERPRDFTPSALVIVGEIRMPERAAERLSAMATERGLTRAMFVQRLFEAAYAARCAPTGDAALDEAVAEIDRKPTPRKTIRPAKETARPEPVASIIVPAKPPPLFVPVSPSPPAPTPPPAPSAFAAEKAKAAAIAAATPTPEAMPDERTQKVIRMLRHTGAKPFEIATQMKVPLATVRAILAKSGVR